MENKEYYKEAAIHALAGFQLIEEGLKRYIVHYYDTVRYLLGDKLHFDYNESDVSEAALQRLLSIFSKINSNKELIEQLRKLVKQRDEIAHKAFVELYGPTKSEAEFEKMYQKYVEVGKQLSRLLTAVNDENFKLFSIYKSHAAKKSRKRSVDTVSQRS